MDQREADRVIVKCTETLDTSPDDVVALINRGRAWYWKKDYDKAISDLDKAINANGDCVGLRYIRGLAFSKKGKHNLAIKDFSEALGRGLEKEVLPSGYYNRGRCRWLTQAYDDAIKDLTEAIRLDHRHAKAYMTRGLVWQDLGEYRKAIADYGLAIRNDPRSADTYHNRGNAWVYLGKLRKGIVDFTRAIHLDPRGAATYNSRGISWTRKGRYDKALADYERALELDPHSAYRRGVLAEFLATCPCSLYRDGPRALKLIAEACELRGYSDAAYVGCIAAAHVAMGDFPSAISYQKKALTLATEDDDKECMRRYIELYEAGEPCWMAPPSFRERWS